MIFPARTLHLVRGFSMAMLNNQMVSKIDPIHMVTNGWVTTWTLELIETYQWRHGREPRRMATLESGMQRMTRRMCFQTSCSSNLKTWLQVSGLFYSVSQTSHVQSCPKHGNQARVHVDSRMIIGQPQRIAAATSLQDKIVHDPSEITVAKSCKEENVHSTHDHPKSKVQLPNRA